jgi:hypothetical protein
MASSGKKKTTMAKLNRERKLRERRLDKQTRKDARKQASHQHGQSREVLTGGDDQSITAGTRQTALDPVVQVARRRLIPYRTHPRDHVKLPLA